MKPRNVRLVYGKEIRDTVRLEVPVQGDTVGADGSNPAGKMLAVTSANKYGPATDLKPMSTEAVVAQGSNQAHYNLMPLQVVNFIIATTGTYPSRS